MSKAFETGWNLTAKLAEILGLGDKPIRSIEIRAHCEEVVEVNVNMLVTKDQGGALVEELARYELRRKGEKKTVNETRQEIGLNPLPDALSNALTPGEMALLRRSTRIVSMTTGPYAELHRKEIRLLMDKAQDTIQFEADHQAESTMDVAIPERSPGLVDNFTVADYIEAHPAEDCTCKTLLGLRNCPACLRKRGEE